MAAIILAQAFLGIAHPVCRDIARWNGAVLRSLHVAVGVIGTGLPAAVVLIMAASAGALLGVVSNIIPASLLWALPGRLINL